MDAYAAAAGHVPDDGISWHWLTALGVAHHQAVDALDAYALRSPHPVDESLERARLRGIRVRVEIGVDELQNLQSIDVALADRRQEVCGIGQVERPRRALQRVVPDLREPAPLELPLENVLPQLRRRLLRLLAHHLADLVTRAAGAYG